MSERMQKWIQHLRPSRLLHHSFMCQIIFTPKEKQSNHPPESNGKLCECRCNCCGGDAGKREHISNERWPKRTEFHATLRFIHQLQTLIHRRIQIYNVLFIIIIYSVCVATIVIPLFEIVLSIMFFSHSSCCCLICGQCTHSRANFLIDTHATTFHDTWIEVYVCM